MNEEHANRIADYANECCHRSDGYAADVAAFALVEIETIVKAYRVILRAVKDDDERYHRLSPDTYQRVCRALAADQGRPE